MKDSKLYPLLFLLSTFSCSSHVRNGSEMSAAGYKRYPMKSGVIEYTFNGKDRVKKFEGKQIVYFDNWGMREATYKKSEATSTTTMRVSDMEPMQFTDRKTSNTLNLIDGEWTYEVDLDSKIGRKTKKGIGKEFSPQMDENNTGLMMEKIRMKSGMRRVGSEEILGKMCEVWESQSGFGKAWYWNAIPLKREYSSNRENHTYIAIRIEENVTVDEDKFAIPPSISIRK